MESQNHTVFLRNYYTSTWIILIGGVYYINWLHCVCFVAFLFRVLIWLAFTHFEGFALLPCLVILIRAATLPPLHSHHLPTRTYSVNGIGTPWVNVCGTPEGLSTLASSLLPHTSNKSITKNMEPTTTRAQTGRPLATGKLLCCYRACNRSLSREVCSSARFSSPIIFHFALSRISSHPRNQHHQNEDLFGCSCRSYSPCCR